MHWKLISMFTKRRYLKIHIPGGIRESREWERDEKPFEIDPDDSAKQVDDDEDRNKDDDQVTGVGDDSSRRVHVRHNRPTQLVTMKTKLFPVNDTHASNNSRRCHDSSLPVIYYNLTTLVTHWNLRHSHKKSSLCNVFLPILQL